MKKENNLKPCPFCGGKAHLESSHGFNNVSCENCGTEYPVSFETRERAAAVWNKRSIEDELHEEINRLESENARLRQALAFYAEMENDPYSLEHFIDGINEVFKEFHDDGQSYPMGERARQALKGKKDDE